MKYFFGLVRFTSSFPKVGVFTFALAALNLTATAQPATRGKTQTQQPQVLIPIRGVPFGPGIPIVPIQPETEERALQPAALQQTPVAQSPVLQQQGGPAPVQQAAVAQQQALSQPPQPAGTNQRQSPLGPAQQAGSTQQSVSLLPTELAARQAAAVAASVVPPEHAITDISKLAGEYSYGNGFDMNCTLEISPEGRFLYKRCGCDDVVDQAEGNVALTETGQVVLSPAKARETWPRGTAPVLVPVAWGQRLYLVPENDMVGFLNQVNRGLEPVSRGNMGSYYLREGDWDRPVEGAPELPEQYAAMVLEQPLQGAVAGKDPAGRWIINLGKVHGIYDGMELSGIREDGQRFVTLRVTETGTETSAVELLDQPEDLAVQGWTVYSRIASPVIAEE